MRISTNTMFDMGIGQIQQRTADLFKLQQQLSTGRRILTPADDPVGSARVLEVSQSLAQNQQFDNNTKTATGALALEEAALTSVGTLIQDVRTLAIQAGNGTYDHNNLSSLASELKERYQELIGLANSTDGNGQYLFSGYRGATMPFSETTPGTVTYNGDQGQRMIQISPSRQIPVSDAGSEIFMNVWNGNGTFVTAAATTAQNTGTAVVSPGNVLDPGKWDAVVPVLPVNPAGANPNDRFSVVFAVDNSVVPNVTTYDIVANIDITLNPPAVAAATTITAGTSLITGVASTTQPSTDATAGPRLPRIYTPNEAISLKKLATDGVADPATKQPAFAVPAAWDAGIELSIQGTPASTLVGALPASFAGVTDSFTIMASDRQTSLFETLDRMITALEQMDGTTSGRAQLSNDLNTAILNLDQAQESVLKVRAFVGARMKEIDAVKATGEDVALQYQKTISELQDLDYAKAISDLAKQQMTLEAAQKTFTKVQGLTLFDYI